MSATEGKQYAVGMRHAQILALDASGYPAATGTTAYEGYEIVGAKAFDVVMPDARRINHVGNDRILAQDFLPPIEGASATLRTGRHDYDVHAVLTDTNEVTIGEAKLIGYGTDKQGQEPDIGMVLFQQSKTATAKTRTWRGYILPSTNVVLKPASMNDSPAEFEYQVLPQVCTQHLWGVDFDSDTEGFTEAQLLEIQTTDMPWVCAWKADAATTDFLFPTAHQPTATAKIHVVAQNGAAITTGFTKYTTSIVFAATQTSGNMLVAFYEVSSV